MTIQFTSPQRSPEIRGCAVHRRRRVRRPRADATRPRRIDEKSGGAIKRLIDGGDSTGKIGSTHALFGLAGMKAPRVLLVGLGEQKKFDAVRSIAPRTKRRAC